MVAVLCPLGFGMVAVGHWYVFGTVEVRVWHPCGMGRYGFRVVLVCLWHGAGVIWVRMRYGSHTVLVRLWYGFHMAWLAWLRYGCGTLWIWFGCGSGLGVVLAQLRYGVVWLWCGSGLAMLLE